MTPPSPAQPAADPSQTSLAISYRRLAERHDKRRSGWLSSLNIWLLVMVLISIAAASQRFTSIDLSVFSVSWTGLLIVIIICIIRYLRERRLCDYYNHRAAMMTQLQILIDQNADQPAVRDAFIQEAAREITRDPGLRR